jgi:hypothetical protein
LRPRRGGFDFAQESFHTDERGELAVHHLDGNLAVVTDVVGQVDIRHPAAANLPLDGVAVRQRLVQAIQHLNHAALAGKRRSMHPRGHGSVIRRFPGSFETSRMVLEGRRSRSGANCTTCTYRCRLHGAADSRSHHRSTARWRPRAMRHTALPHCSPVSSATFFSETSLRSWSDRVMQERPEWQKLFAE